MTPTALALTADDAARIVEVLVDAFRDYPAMRFVLGEEAGDDARLETLITLFVRSRFARGGAMLGIRDAGAGLVAAATLTRPSEPEPGAGFLEWREEVWARLGEDARRRYRAFADATSTFLPAAPHHHLNMIGVRGAWRGRGLARPLLEAVHALAAGDSRSAGVSLTTEHAPNVALYERFGYRLLGHVRVADTLESWAMFRPATGVAAPTL